MDFIGTAETFLNSTDSRHFLPSATRLEASTLIHKRSRLFLGLSLPGGSSKDWSYLRETELFQDLRKTCKTERHVRYEELPAAPSIVPYLLKKKNPTKPLDLLHEAIQFSDSPEGKKYCEWWRELRGGLQMGRVSASTMRDIHRVSKALRADFAVDGEKVSEARVSFEGEVSSGPFLARAVEAKLKAKVDNLPLRMPHSEWLRRWIVEPITLNAHSRVLLRVARAQNAHENLVLALSRLWGPVV